jgi:hypothetical protein
MSRKKSRLRKPSRRPIRSARETREEVVIAVVFAGQPQELVSVTITENDVGLRFVRRVTPSSFHRKRSQPQRISEHVGRCLRPYLAFRKFAAARTDERGLGAENLGDHVQSAEALVGNGMIDICRGPHKLVSAINAIASVLCKGNLLLFHSKALGEAPC